MPSQILVGNRLVQGAPATLHDSFTVTLAQINAGYNLPRIVRKSGVRWKVLAVRAKVAGTFTTGTLVRLITTEATPVVVMTLAQANIDDGADLVEGETGFALGAGYRTPLAVGHGLKVDKTGSAFAGGTSITFEIDYQLYSGHQYMQGAA